MICRAFRFLWLIFHLEVHSQTSNYTGLGAFSRNQRDGFSFIVQPAALARGQDMGVGMFAERKFLINELTRAGVVMILPTAKGCFGITAGSQLGGYRQQESSLSYGRLAGARIHLGARFFWNNYNAGGYYRNNQLGAGLGMNILLTENLVTGVMICSAFNLSKPDKRVFNTYRIGLGYDVSELVHLSAQIIKEQAFPAGLVAGIHYQLVKTFWVRGGVNTSVSGWWMGCGFSFKAMRIDVINNYHPQLGLTPAITIYYPFKNLHR